MANQSNIQQLLQDVTGVHGQSQSWVPSSVNNGNPNTAYNNSSATVIPFTQPKAIYQANPTKTGYIPPMTNGVGGWATNPLNPPPLPNWQQMSAANQGVGMPKGFAGWGDLNGTGVGWTPDAVGVGTPPPTLPPGTPGTGTPGTNTGGNLPPAVVHNGNGGDKLITGYGGGGTNKGGRGLDWLDMPPGSLDGYFNTKPGEGLTKSNDFTGAFSQLGDLNIPLGSAGQSLFNTSLGKALGVTQNGDISALQIIDWITPGNVYMSQTQQFNWANAIPGLLSKISPALALAVTKYMDYKGAQYANVDDSKLGTGILGWLRRLLKNRYNKNQANKNAANNPGGNGDFGSGGPGSFGNTLGQGGFMGGSYGWGGGTGGHGSFTVGDFQQTSGGSSGGSGTLGGIPVDQK